jgi:hypothetical protein
VFSIQGGIGERCMGHGNGRRNAGWFSGIPEDVQSNQTITTLDCGPTSRGTDQTASSLH